MNQPQIRYVHIKDTSPKAGIDGFTIAYVRGNNFVFFAWTEKCIEDQYVKEIGREYSSQRLVLIEKEMIEYAAENRVCVNFDHMIGVVSISYFIDGLDSVFSDQLVDQLGMFDFKHSFISSVLKQIVVNQEF